MPIFTFPNQGVLRLALKAGWAAAAGEGKPIPYGVQEDGRLWVEAAVDLRSKQAPDVKSLGVEKARMSPIPLDQTAMSWAQLAPLEPAPTAAGKPVVGDKTPVLFVVPDVDGLSDLMVEILRLGNDRQGFRLREVNGRTEALLRVVGPPYYSLLRALDPSSAPSTSIHDAPAFEALRRVQAYVERSPRIWTPITHTHPLLADIHPAPGTWLLLDPPRSWRVIEEQRFHDLYDSLDFPLHNGVETWTEVEPLRRIDVPLRLVRSGGVEPDELWVLDGAGEEKLDEFVQSANAALVSRLAFAVAEVDGRRRVLLRVRPSKDPPPALVLEAQAYRSYIKLPNLFMPSGQRLHPQLRRDAVKQLLAPDMEWLTWLEPLPDGRFAPRRVLETAFQPLENWVDYVLDQDAGEFSAWMKSTQFEFDPFLCSDDGAVGRRKGSREPLQEELIDQNEEPPPEEQPPPLVRKPTRKPRKSDAPADAAPEFEQAPDRELQERLTELETKFLGLSTPPEDPRRRELWRDMARLNRRLKHRAAAGVCWLNALWEDESPDPDWWLEWRRCEADDPETATNPATASRGENAPHASKAQGLQVDSVLTDPNPTPTQVHWLAAHLCWLAFTEQPLGDWESKLGEVRHYLERNDHLLPVRAVWLAWSAAARVSQDVLALARTRDRLLQRLFANGLSPDRDLPDFLRGAGLTSGDRFRSLRDHITRLAEQADRWCEADSGHVTANTATPYYVRLQFAYALARLGESNHALTLLGQARAHFKGADEVHRWCLAAFEHRIRQALELKPAAGQLPAELLSALNGMERLNRYKIDRLRQHSRILEPHEKIDPYRSWVQRFADGLGQELALLFDEHQPETLRKRLHALIDPRDEQYTPQQQCRVAAGALELAPRLGEAFAKQALQYAGKALKVQPEPVDQAKLLERGLFLAAHFDQPSYVQLFTAQFQSLLDPRVGGGIVQELGALMSHSFRSLRKLGMRDEISRLLDGLAELTARAQPPPSRSGVEPTPIEREAESQRLLLQVASGWFYFGQADRAYQVLDRVRTMLFERVEKRRLPPIHQTRLACAYIEALAQAPVDDALHRLHELFRDLRNVNDTFTTNSHYSVSKLDVVEAMTSSLISDDFTADKSSRRWLDEDEFFIRRRIHRDVREAMAQAEL